MRCVQWGIANFRLALGIMLRMPKQQKLFKKTSPPQWQKNKIMRRWAKRGSRPSAPDDQRTRSAYIFGAICPRHGKAAALIMPWCDTHAMNRHLIEISRNVADDAHAILMMDQAGWHMSNNLAAPENITIFPLPPKSPELNPWKTSGSL